MLNLFLRCIIIYFFLLIAMRLMGKRQLGELQPFELAITLVASELACIPMSDPTIPILYGVIPVFTLFLVHLLITRLASKSVRFRKLLNGKPVIVIDKGNILPKTLKELNMTVDDLMEALRGNGCFDPGDVQYAIVETNGSMTVLPKAEQKPVCARDIGISVETPRLPVTMIMEGRFVGPNIALVGEESKKRVLQLLSYCDLKQSDVLVLLVAGERVFLQPYSGDSFAADLNEEGFGVRVSVKNGEGGKA